MSSENIARLYEIIQNGSWTVEIEKEARTLIEALTDEKLVKNKRERHPVLHELCQQLHFPCNFQILKLVWSYPKFKKYLDTENYVDCYGNTVLQRLLIYYQ